MSTAKIKNQALLQRTSELMQKATPTRTDRCQRNPRDPRSLLRITNPKVELCHPYGSCTLQLPAPMPPRTMWPIGLLLNILLAKDTSHFGYKSAVRFGKMRQCRQKKGCQGKKMQEHKNHVCTFRPSLWVREGVCYTSCLNYWWIKGDTPLRCHGRPSATNTDTFGWRSEVSHVIVHINGTATSWQSEAYE